MQKKFKFFTNFVVGLISPEALSLARGMLTEGAKVA